MPRALTSEHLAIMALKDTPSSESGVYTLDRQQTELLYEAYDIIDEASRPQP